MAERTSYTIAEEIKGKLKDDSITADEIMGLFREAYEKLPNDDSLRKSIVNKLNVINNNARKSKKISFSDEQKEELLALRDGKEYKPKTKENKQNENIDEKNNEDKDHEKVELTKEQKVVLQTVMVGDFDKLDFIEVKASKASLKQALESNKPEEALGNVDDLLVANKYFAKDKKYNAILDSVINGQLEALLLNPSNITPDNATAYVALCKTCGNQELCDKVLATIADALIKYDKENFGGKDAAALLESYEKLQIEAAKVDPFAKNDNPNKDLSGTVFSNTKKGKEQKDAVSNLAREMAVQRLAARGSYTAEELKEEIRKSAETILLASGPVVKNGKYNVDSDTLSSTIANQYIGIEDFKKRCEQKFKNAKIVKKVSSKVDKIDKDLTDRFGKKYVYAKKATRFVGKVVVGGAKSVAMFSAAGLVPGGTAVLMGYYIGKSIKDTYNDLTNKDKTKMEKVCSVMKTGFTTMLSATGMAASLEQGADTLVKAGFDGAGQIMRGIGNSIADITGKVASLGGAVCSPEAISSAMLNMSKYTRMGVITATTALPNITKSCSLAVKSFNVSRKIKKASKNGKEEEVAKLLKQQKELKAQKIANYKEMGIKTASIVGGMFVAQAVAPVINEAIHDTIEKGENIVKNVNAMAEQNGWKGSVWQNDMDGSENARTSLLDQGVDNSFGRMSNEAFNDSINQQQEDIGQKINALLEGKDAGTTISFSREAGDSTNIKVELVGPNGEKFLDVDSTQLKEVTGDVQKMFAQFEAQNGDGQNSFIVAKTADGIDASSEFKSTEMLEIAKNNLEAARAENSSGINGVTTFDDTKAHLSFDSRIENTEEFATKLCESFGDDANKVTIACKMAPYALQEVLGIEGVETPTSYNMLSHIAENPLTAEQSQALDKFLNDNFEGSRFRTENYSDWNYQKNPVIENNNDDLIRTPKASLPEMQGLDLQEINRPTIDMGPIELPVPGAGASEAQIAMYNSEHGISGEALKHTVENGFVYNKEMSEALASRGYVGIFNDPDNPDKVVVVAESSNGKISSSPVDKVMLDNWIAREQEAIYQDKVEEIVNNQIASYNENNGLSGDVLECANRNGVMYNKEVSEALSESGYLGVFNDPQNPDKMMVITESKNDEVIANSVDKADIYNRLGELLYRQPDQENVVTKEQITSYNMDKGVSGYVLEYANENSLIYNKDISEALAGSGYLGVFNDPQNPDKIMVVTESENNEVVGNLVDKAQIYNQIGETLSAQQQEALEQIEQNASNVAKNELDASKNEVNSVKETPKPTVENRNPVNEQQVENRQAQAEETVRQRVGNIPKIDVPDTGNRLVDDLNDKWACSDGQGRGFKFDGVEVQNQQPNYTPQQMEPQTYDNRGEYAVSGAHEYNNPHHNMSSLVVRNPWEYASAGAYARASNLELDLDLTKGLNRVGDGVSFDGYAGAYKDIDDPNRVVILPNNMRDDFNAIREYELKDVVKLQRVGNNDGDSPYNHLDHAYNGHCACPKVEHYHGSGYISDNPTVNRVVEIIGGIGEAIHGLGHLAERVGQIFGNNKGGGSRGWG